MHFMKINMQNPDRDRNGCAIINKPGKTTKMMSARDDNRGIDLRGSPFDMHSFINPQ
jgi:hypothetical protein